jgi:hypothetical protein
VVTTESAKELASSMWDEVTIGLNVVPGLRPEAGAEVLIPVVGVGDVGAEAEAVVGSVGGTEC